MSVLSSLFSPKYKLFFGLFEKAGNQLVAISEEFQILVNAQNLSDAEVSQAKIQEIERLTDDITNEILTELGRNFITPFDREDIHDLASRLDDVADHIQTSANRIVLYKYIPTNEYMKEFQQLIYSGVQNLNIATRGLRNLKKNKDTESAIKAIDVMEKKADQLYDKAISDLLDNEDNMKEFVKKRDIYQKLELITDVIEDASIVIESIMIKYA